MKTHELECMSKELWSKKRKTSHNALDSNFNYTQKVNGKSDYLTYFSAAAFALLDHRQKLKHTLYTCKECANVHTTQWKLFKLNKLIATPIESVPSLLEPISDKHPT